MEYNPANRELIDHIVGSLFDSNPIQFKPIHKQNHGPLIKHLNSENPNEYELPSEILRNTFLMACRNFTKNEQIEHLIIAYGLIFGGGADIQHVQHIMGTHGSVNIPQQVEYNIRNWLLFQSSAEVAIFHNHPKTELSKSMGKDPWPSSQDRTTLLIMKWLNPLLILYRIFGSTNRIKFYLGEKGKVIEIKGSSLTAILDLLSN